MCASHGQVSTPRYGDFWEPLFGLFSSHIVWKEEFVSRFAQHREWEARTTWLSGHLWLSMGHCLGRKLGNSWLAAVREIHPLHSAWVAGAGGGSLTGKLLADKISGIELDFKRGKCVVYRCFLLINFIWIILAILIQKHFERCVSSPNIPVFSCVIKIRKQKIESDTNKELQRELKGGDQLVCILKGLNRSLRWGC